MTRKRQIRYGALAAGVLAVAAGLIFFTQRVDRAVAPSPADNAASAEGAAKTPASRGTAPATAAVDLSASGDDVTVVSAQRRDEAVALIADARRQAAAGDYAAADASLARAEKAVPDLPEIRQARDAIARLRTPEGRFADDIRRARLAVDHDDIPAAETALADAARLKPDAPEIGELRAALQASRDRKVQRETRIAEALARMRDAVARRDFAAANSALNEAERIDMQEPGIRRARRELARAEDARQKASE